MPFWAKVEVFLLDSEAQDSKIEGYAHLKNQYGKWSSKRTKVPRYLLLGYQSTLSSQSHHSVYYQT